MTGGARVTKERIPRAGVLVTTALGIATSLALTEPAQACGGGMGAPNAAFPAPGATNVSPLTSIVLRASSDGLPPGLALTANGSPVPLPSVTRLGPGLTAAGYATFFQLRGGLMPSTNYVLTIAAASGTAPVELTHFSTAATYDKEAAGTPPVIKSLQLWRAHYPESEIGAGGCVSAAYEGYFDLEFTPGVVPGTPAEETVSILSLSSKQTVLFQNLVFMGLDKLPGGFVDGTAGDIPLPGGGSLSAPSALWNPVLEAGGTTCATITTFGRNDLSALPLQSDTICVPVTSVDSPHLSQGAGGAGAAGGRGGPDASGGSTGAPGATGKTGGNGGCSVVPARGGGALALAILGLIAGRRRRRQ